MDIQLLLVPYDSGQRGWRCGGGPEHLVRAGLPAHLQRQGHVVTAIHIIEDDPTYPSRRNPNRVRQRVCHRPRPWLTSVSLGVSTHQATDTLHFSVVVIGHE